MDSVKRVLVLCTGNSCRSQMAEGWLRHFADTRAEIFSAGIVASGLNPKAVAVMKESGIDISRHASKTVEMLPEKEFDFVITVCDNAKEHCPYFPATTKLLHRNFEDPTYALGTPEEILDAYRATRDLLKEYCKRFVDEIL